MSKQLSDKDLDYLAWLNDSHGVMSCMCRALDHPHDPSKDCDAPAVVTVELHLPHMCRHPAMTQLGLVNAAGIGVQMLCGDCYVRLRAWADAKIAQQRALCQQLSLTCQRCGFGPLIGPVHGDPEPWARPLPLCPVCALPRIEFKPVCGSDRDKATGTSFGCGAPLTDWRDIIRGEKWEATR